MTFEQWLAEVDAIFADFYHGMTTESFEDWLWYDEFMKDKSPTEAHMFWALNT